VPELKAARFRFQRENVDYRNDQIMVGTAANSCSASHDGDRGGGRRSHHSAPY
jgi:hypothetical protein